jgi:type III secretory pathway component EscS
MAAKGSDIVRATGILALILTAVFFPFVVGQSSLLMSTWDATSVVSTGAYDPTAVPRHYGRALDPGAPAWASEPWLKLIGNQIWKEQSAPLWNPYSAYGTPLAAAMQPQSFYPLAILASLHVSAWTYNLFILGRLLVAGVLMFLFARLFLAKLPSITSAITFMLTGYFIVSLNMPHLSVEVLTPGMFLTFEIILRRNSWVSVAGAAGMIVLGIVAGMPESVFLSLAASSLYFVCRLSFTAEFRAAANPLLAKFIIAVTFGFLLSAFLLFPFVELLRLGHDVHQPSNVGGDRVGLYGDADVRGTIFYLLPLLFGPINNSIMSDMSGWTGMRSYWGIVPSILAAVAVFSLIFANRKIQTKSYQFLISFFFIMLTLMILKRFASPIINWIGLLPISEMVLYLKYQEPIIALCIAMLAGLGCLCSLNFAWGGALSRPRLWR